MMQPRSGPQGPGQASAMCLTSLRDADICDGDADAREPRARQKPQHVAMPLVHGATTADCNRHGRSAARSHRANNSRVIRTFRGTSYPLPTLGEYRRSPGETV